MTLMYRVYGWMVFEGKGNVGARDELVSRYTHVSIVDRRI